MTCRSCTAAIVYTSRAFRAVTNNTSQAMARSHRIGQAKTVKVFRLVTRSSYEAELVQTANRKLGLERAFASADAFADASADGPRSGCKGAPQDRKEIERMLRCGAVDIFIDDDTAFRKFSEADIDTLLETASSSCFHAADAGGSSFAKAFFRLWTHVLHSAIPSARRFLRCSSLPRQFCSARSQRLKPSTPVAHRLVSLQTAPRST